MENKTLNGCGERGESYGNFSKPPAFGILPTNMALCTPLSHVLVNTSSPLKIQCKVHILHEVFVKHDSTPALPRHPKTSPLPPIYALYLCFNLNS